MACVFEKRSRPAQVQGSGNWWELLDDAQAAEVLL
jgi:hypothetical protein